MKFSPTITLAAALAVGLAGAAAAQTTASPTTTTTPSATAPQTTAPQAGYNAAQPTAPPAGAAYNQTAPATQQQPSMAQSPGAGNAEIRQAQQQLAAAGLYHGAIDGVMDPDTRAAIANFQQQRGLPRSEQLDQQTMTQLMSAQPTGVGSSAPGASSMAPAGQGSVVPSGQTPTAAQPSAGYNSTAPKPTR